MKQLSKTTISGYALLLLGVLFYVLAYFPNLMGLYTEDDRGLNFRISLIGGLYSVALLLTFIVPILFCIQYKKTGDNSHKRGFRISLALLVFAWVFPYIAMIIGVLFGLSSEA